MTELATTRVAEATPLARSAPCGSSVSRDEWVLPARVLRHKRALDLVVGLPLAVLALPVVLFFAACCAVAVRGNPFFVQTRPGRGRRELRILKLRTLPKSHPHYGVKPELLSAAVPRFQRWLRRRHLDELPQLFSVLTGHMSLVGPRPRQHAEVDAIDPDLDQIRRCISQGCTGLWQVSVANQGFLADGIGYDLFYLEHLSLRFDLWILYRTFLAMFGLAGAVDFADVPAWVVRDNEVAPPILSLSEDAA